MKTRGSGFCNTNGTSVIFSHEHDTGSGSQDFLLVAVHNDHNWEVNGRLFFTVAANFRLDCPFALCINIAANTMSDASVLMVDREGTN